jgi:hypothetical protein
MKREGSGSRIAPGRVLARSKRVHHVAGQSVSRLVLREGDRYLAAAIGLAMVVPHAAQRRRNVARVGSMIFHGEGDIRLLFGSWLCRQRTYRFAIAANQPHLVTSVLREGDGLGATAALQRVCNVIGEAVAV